MNPDLATTSDDELADTAMCSLRIETEDCCTQHNIKRLKICHVKLLQLHNIMCRISTGAWMKNKNTLSTNFANLSEKILVSAAFFLSILSAFFSAPLNNHRKQKHILRLNKNLDCSS